MCNCIDRVNEQLKPKKSELHIPEVVDFTNGKCASADRVMIITDKIVAKRYGNGQPLFATYCPFCGEKYFPGPQ
jgi:hypothetical protein